MIEDAESRGRKRGDGGQAFDDSELLRRYADTRSEAAFAELVRRRIGMVYSVALRHTRGDRHRAEDATQAVFTDLARKAHTLAQRPGLAGWLYRSAQFAATGMIRSEQRRQAREQEADTMEKILAPDEPESDWDRVRPVLDEALNEMDERDRDVILLRFFDGRPYADIGARWRLTEGAARMRVERALDKLNAALARRGITSTTAALGVALGHPIGAAMPAGLAATVTGAALAGTAANAGGWLATFMNISKLQAGIAGAVAAAGAVGFGLQAQTNAGLRREIAALRQPPQLAATLRAENQQLASAAAEVELLRRDDVELKQLAQSVAEAQRANNENARIARLREGERNAQAEIERMNREGNALVEEFKSLTAKSKEGSLTAEARAQAEAVAKAKLEEIKAKQREIQAFIANARLTYPNLPGRTMEAGRSATSGEKSSKEQWTPADNERVSLRLPQADPTTLLSVYERVSRSKIIRDPSIAGIQGMFDLQTGPCTQEEMKRALQDTLRDKLNIVLEPQPDGTVVAKLAPPR